jgi:hypothetical protein
MVRKSVDGYQVADGPHSAAKEVRAGFWIISAADADAALEWARQATAACRMVVEIRALASLGNPLMAQENFLRSRQEAVEDPAQKQPRPRSQRCQNSYS